MSATTKAAIVRGVRSFVAAFLVIYPVPLLIDAASGENPVDWSLARAAAVSGGVAVVSFLWRQFLDPSPIPSLVDADQPANPAAPAVRGEA